MFFISGQVELFLLSGQKLLFLLSGQVAVPFLLSDTGAIVLLSGQEILLASEAGQEPLFLLLLSKILLLSEVLFLDESCAVPKLAQLVSELAVSAAGKLAQSDAELFF